MIQLESVSKAYGGRGLFRDLTWQLAGRERIGRGGRGPLVVRRFHECLIVAAGREQRD